MAEAASGMAAFEAPEPEADWFAIEEFDFLLNANPQQDAPDWLEQVLDATSRGSREVESPIDWPESMNEPLLGSRPSTPQPRAQVSSEHMDGNVEDAPSPPNPPTLPGVQAGRPSKASNVGPADVSTGKALEAATQRSPVESDDLALRFARTMSLRSPGGANLSPEGKVMVDESTCANPPMSQLEIAQRIMVSHQTVLDHVRLSRGDKPRDGALKGASNRYLEPSRREMSVRSRMGHSHSDIANYFGCTTATVDLAAREIPEADRLAANPREPGVSRKSQADLQASRRSAAEQTAATFADHDRRLEETKHLRSPGGTTPSAAGRLMIDRRCSADPPESQTQIAGDSFLPVAAIRQSIRESLGGSPRPSSVYETTKTVKRYKPEAIEDIRKRARLGQSNLDIANWHGSSTTGIARHKGPASAAGPIDTTGEPGGSHAAPGSGDQD